LGEDGVVVNRFLLIAHSIKFASEFLLQQPGSCNLKDLLLTKTSTRKGGRESFLKEGDILKQPVLANAFKLVAKHGFKVLYEGPLAEANIRSSSNTLLGMIARIIEVIITLYLASPVQQPNFSFRYEKHTSLIQMLLYISSHFNHLLNDKKCMTTREQHEQQKRRDQVHNFFELVKKLVEKRKSSV